MDLNRYIYAIKTDGTKIYTPPTMEVPANLCTEFHALMTLSDKEVKEYGCNLRYIQTHGSGRLEIERDSSTTLKIHAGDFSGVSLESDTAYLHAQYIGDFHTHPYLKRYKSATAIGPSYGDWEGWVQYYPQNSDVGVFMVASADQLFLMISRGRPGVLPGGKLSRLDIQAFKDITQHDYKTYVALETELGTKQFDAYANILTKSYPQAIKAHQQGTLAMNKELARQMNWELYQGKLNQQSSSTLSLTSDFVVGSSWTNYLWSRTDDYWLINNWI
ncbi:hypothetical protein E8F20_21190 [Pseudomonas sp. BN415]|uniref:hypothetical protein n=1 Tax=Pseudomonas sp. BN415 TaxID=2567889 RepID=UPI002458E753|nr:hypothetical protein [Pseudomonas sp. BN415]MDH4584378.1 hypothetical protein [Pseudomonas sp. BN415]